jgi:hypothetical protein
VLHLPENEIVTIGGLTGLTSLTVLDLNLNRRIPVRLLTALANLRSLSFTNYWDECHDADMLGLTNLTRLQITGNTVISDRGIVGLVNLRSLTLRDDKAITNNGISGLTNLAEIRINFCIHKNITEDCLRALPNLFRFSSSTPFRNLSVYEF